MKFRWGGRYGQDDKFEHDGQPVEIVNLFTYLA